MCLKKELLQVSESASGWVVKCQDGREQLGPYSDREEAIASALVIAKGTRARHVRVFPALGEWLIECTYGESPVVSPDESNQLAVSPLVETTTWL